MTWVGETSRKKQSLGHPRRKVMRKSVWKDIAIWPTERPSSCTKAQLHVQTTNFKKGELETVRALSKVCSQSLLKCLFLARIGGLDIFWSGNKLAWAVTEWTRACDERLARVISYIRQTCDHGQYFDMGNAAQLCRLGLFQDLDFAGDLEDSKSTSGCGFLCIFRSRTFVPTSCMRKTQTSHAVQQNLKMSHWMVYVWTEYPRLIFGTWQWKCCILQKTFRHRETDRAMRSTFQHHHNEDTRQPISSRVV